MINVAKRLPIKYFIREAKQVKKGLLGLFGLFYLLVVLWTLSVPVFLLNQAFQAHHEDTNRIHHLEQSVDTKEKKIHELEDQIRVLAAKKRETKIVEAIVAEAYVQPVVRTQQVVVASVAPPAPSGDVKGMIVAAATKYGVSADWLLRVANCESGYNPNSVNHTYYAGGGNPSGVFQFLPQTWNTMSVQAGFGGQSVFNAYANVNVAAWAFSKGYSNQWECR